jgi:ketosteroid isomerase-like protein
MSQENVKTVLHAAAAFNRGDLDAWSECWADTSTIGPARAHPMTMADSWEGGPARLRAGLARHVRRFQVRAHGAVCACLASTFSTAPYAP